MYHTYQLTPSSGYFLTQSVQDIHPSYPTSFEIKCRNSLIPFMQFVSRTMIDMLCSALLRFACSPFLSFHNSTSIILRPRYNHTPLPPQPDSIEFWQMPFPLLIPSYPMNPLKPPQFPIFNVFTTLQHSNSTKPTNSSLAHRSYTCLKPIPNYSYEPSTYIYLKP